MRDPNRLDKFYDEMKTIHKMSFPDWRFGQLMSNFLGWVFPEEEEMIKYFREYANSTSPLYRGN